eukprot:12174278-Karenia_brevis.AAC.1
MVNVAFAVLLDLAMGVGAIHCETEIDAFMTALHDISSSTEAFFMTSWTLFLSVSYQCHLQQQQLLVEQH